MMRKCVRCDEKDIDREKGKYFCSNCFDDIYDMVTGLPWTHMSWLGNLMEDYNKLEALESAVRKAIECSLSNEKVAYNILEEALNSKDYGECKSERAKEI